MRHTILLIEDKKTIAENIRSLLELHDYNVLTANNGADGVAIAKIERPDLVISDIYMPALNGYELLEIFMEDEEMRNIPVIMLSAKNEIDEISLAMSKGAAGYITKPFLFRNLHAAIQKALSGRH